MKLLMSLPAVSEWIMITLVIIVIYVIVKALKRKRP